MVSDKIIPVFDDSVHKNIFMLLRYEEELEEELYKLHVTDKRTIAIAKGRLRWKLLKKKSLQEAMDYAITKALECL
jgi:hypothetical protein